MLDIGEGSTAIDCALLTIATMRDAGRRNTLEHVRHLENGFPENVILANRDFGTLSI